MEVRPGQLVMLSDHRDFVIGKVDLVRARTVTVFPWNGNCRKFARRRRKFHRWQLIYPLPPGIDPALADAAISARRNLRDAERRAAQSRFEQEVHNLMKEGTG